MAALKPPVALVHLAHPLGVKGFAYRRVKNGPPENADLADLLRMEGLPHVDAPSPDVAGTPGMEPVSRHLVSVVHVILHHI